MSSELGVERPTSLALNDPPVERRVHFSEVEARAHTQKTPSPRKPRPDRDFRRKRSLSFSGPGGEYRGNKRRKRGRVLPSKFLLGGSITDPLNLGSLDDEEEIPPAGSVDGGGSSSSSNTGASRRWAAVRVIIPPNINDPLNLDASSDNEDLLTDAFHRSLRRRRRNRKRKRRLSEPGDTSGALKASLVEEAEEGRVGILAAPFTRHPHNSLKPLTVNTELTALPGPVDAHKESGGPVTPTGSKPPGAGGSGVMPRLGVFKKQRSKSDNKIVSPVIPQPGGERKRHPSHNRHYADKPHLSQQNLQPPATFNPKNEVFQYGNYNKYYGYRNPASTPDPRLQYLKREWFGGREVLDVGCNIGHVALTIARDYSPKRVVGIDIDKKLINIANKNIKHYLRKGDPEEAAFPSSMRLLYGPLKTPVRADGTRAFPYNIKFLHANYVLESDELLETVRPEFDLILCLSITKWIHLNWGDSGLKRFFCRCFHNLKPGGRFILEPQAWPSYNKRRKLTKRIFDNYKSIRLFPDKFNDYLLHDVGFSTSEKMGTPHHAARGFQRPLIVYTKAGGSSKCSPAGESGGRDGISTQPAEKCQQEVKSAECDVGNSVTSRVDPSVDTLKQTKRSLCTHSGVEDRISSIQEKQDNIETDKGKDPTKLGKPEMHKNTVPNFIVSDQGTQSQNAELENCKCSNNSDEIIKNVCDNKITGDSGEKSCSVTHSLSTGSQLQTASFLVDQHVNKTSADIQAVESSKLCASCGKDRNVFLTSSLGEGISTGVKDCRTVNVLLNCKCSGGVDIEQSQKSDSIVSDNKTEEKCSDSKIQFSECPADDDVSKEPVGNSETNTMSEVVPGESKSLGMEELHVGTGSGHKRQHIDTDTEEGDVGSEVQAEESSKKLRLEDT